MFYIKKSLLFICIIVLVAVVLIILIKIHTKGKYIDVLSPTKNKIVILDAGHGYPDERCF